MLDINLIRENPEKVKQGVAAKGYDAGLVDRVLELDKKHRELVGLIENLQAERNKVAQARDIKKGKKLKVQLAQKEPELKRIEKEFQEALLAIPNLLLEGVPKGGEEDFQLIKKEGETKKFSFTPRDHVELGEMLDIIDIPRAAKVSGSRFGYLKNEGALLEFALVQLAMEDLVKEGFTPIVPPALIKQEITEKLGYWQGGGNENYYLVSDFEVDGPEKRKPLPLYLIGTGEHSVVPMHSGEVLDEKELPKKYVAFSSCFRREAGSYGKDVRGIFRVHQFDKVEMVAFVKPQDDEDVRRRLLEHAEGFMKSLGLPYQVVKLASGDLGFPIAETIDIETWIPSQDKYRETHSISTTTDFQARRLNIKYKKNGSIGFVHILNGTAFAIGRTILAILENYQEKDGSVKIPEVLQKLVGKDRITPKNL